MFYLNRQRYLILIRYFYVFFLFIIQTDKRPMFELDEGRHLSRIHILIYVRPKQAVIQ